MIAESEGVIDRDASPVFVHYHIGDHCLCSINVTFHIGFFTIRWRANE